MSGFALIGTRARWGVGAWKRVFFKSTLRQAKRLDVAFALGAAATFISTFCNLVIGVSFRPSLTFFAYMLANAAVFIIFGYVSVLRWKYGRLDTGENRESLPLSLFALGALAMYLSHLVQALPDRIAAWF